MIERVHCPVCAGGARQPAIRCRCCWTWTRSSRLSIIIRQSVGQILLSMSCDSHLLMETLSIRPCGVESRLHFQYSTVSMSHVVAVGQGTNRWPCIEREGSIARALESDRQQTFGTVSPAHGGLAILTELGQRGMRPPSLHTNRLFPRSVRGIPLGSRPAPRQQLSTFGEPWRKLLK